MEYTVLCAEPMAHTTLSSCGGGHADGDGRRHTGISIKCQFASCAVPWAFKSSAQHADSTKVAPVVGYAGTNNAMRASAVVSVALLMMPDSRAREATSMWPSVVF